MLPRAVTSASSCSISGTVPTEPKSAVGHRGGDCGGQGACAGSDTVHGRAVCSLRADLSTCAVLASLSS